MNSGADFPGFRDRVAQLVGDEQPFAWAKRIGIPSATFDRMWNAATVPRAEHLLQIARSCGVSVDWLLTGVVQPRPPDDRGGGWDGRSPLDPDLYGRMTEAVAAVYKECGYAIALHQIAAEAARIANDLAELALAPEERPAAIKGAIAHLRRQIRRTVADPDGVAAGKREA